VIFLALFQESFMPSPIGEGRIHVAMWTPDEGEIRGVVQLIHGIGEHILRYDEFARFLAARGCAVIGHDHPGHGESGTRGFIADSGGWDILMAALEAVHKEDLSNFPDLPLFMLGHSMGSFALRHFLTERRERVAGAVLCGTTELTPATERAARIFCRREIKKLGARGVSENLAALCQVSYNNKFRPCRTSADWISADEDEVRRWVTDEKCFAAPSIGLFSDMIDGLAAIRGKAPAWDVPVLLMAGDKDPVSHGGRDARRVGQTFLKSGCTDVMLQLYPECRHELLHEKCRNLVFSDIFEWMESHII
jgi:alpha-beta hydrolase superfamily lysophospholipase